MSRSVMFSVIGLPAPQGSKRHVGNGVMVESSKANKPWRSAVSAEAAERVRLHGCLTGPLELTVLFRFPMPKSRPAAVRAEGVGPKVTAPDTDKLVRSIGDALEAAGLIGSDALICSVRAAKIEVWEAWTGATITVRQITAADLVAAVRGVDR